jgi:hypothetical protein
MALLTRTHPPTHSDRVLLYQTSSTLTNMHMHISTLLCVHTDIQAMAHALDTSSLCFSFSLAFVNSLRFVSIHGCKYVIGMVRIRHVDARLSPTTLGCRAQNVLSGIGYRLSELAILLFTDLLLGLIVIVQCILSAPLFYTRVRVEALHACCNWRLCVWERARQDGTARGDRRCDDGHAAMHDGPAQHTQLRTLSRITPTFRDVAPQFHAIAPLHITRVAAHHQPE